jgi:aquaporin Z
MVSRQKVAMVVAELMGVIVLVTAVYAMVARTTFPLFGGIAAGLTLGVLVHTIGTASGAHVNPAITLGLWSVRKVKTLTALVYIAAQMLGGLAAWALINYFLGTHIQSMANKFEWKILVAEAVGALVFGFGVASAIYQRYEGARAAFTIGGSLTLGMLVASLASNAIVNPAVALGLQSWNVAYVVGPLIGSIVGMNLYALFFAEGINFKPISINRRKTVARAAVKSRAATTRKKPAAKRPANKKRK